MQRAAWVVAAVVALLSLQPVVNMISSRQIMNTSFDPLDLVNTYGAFGTVGRQRLNIVFEGTGLRCGRRPHGLESLPLPGAAGGAETNAAADRALPTATG